MLKIENVVKYYGQVLAVDNLSFEVKKGEIFGLLGVNGAGKTTTFRMIMGLLDKTSGSITLNGKPITYKETERIGFLTEERSLLTKLKVKEQAIYYGTLKGLKGEVIISRLKELLSRFEISEYIDRPIKELSKGNQQKVQFIMAIINDPELLILDEPFSGLDPINVELFMSVIKEYKDKGTSIIFSSHRMEHVELFCEKLIILVKGKSVLQGDLQEIKTKYRKKNIKIRGDINLQEIAKIKGVIEAKKQNLDYVIKIEDEKVAPLVFKEISLSKNITKFEVEEASLNEIFINTVGESYEK